MGLSVTVGLVVYPSFGIVDESRWPVFDRHHVARITLAVGAPWVAQALGLVLWLARDQKGNPVSWWLCAASALASVVLTVASAIRIHDRRHSAFDPQLARALRQMHWLGAASWLIAAAAATTGLSSV